MKSLSGRGELLAFFNNLCCTNYTCVAHLNDAVVYVQVVEMFTGGAAAGPPPFFHKLPSFDCNADDYGDDVPSSARAPMTNARQLNERREANCRFLESLLRSAVPQKWQLQLQPTRLAQGKLQDHLFLLAHLHKWFCSIVAGNSSGRLRFISDPVARRHAAADGKAMSVSLHTPRSASVRESHARFIASLPNEAFAASEMIGGGAQQQQLGEWEERHQLTEQVAQHQQQQQQQNSSNNNKKFGRSATAQPQPSSDPADITQFWSELEDLTIEISRDLDDAAGQLEFRRQQLQRDALALKKLIEQRDVIQQRLRQAYGTIQRDLADGVSDGAHGFRADMHRLFSDTAAGRGLYAPSQVLVGAVQKV